MIRREEGFTLVELMIALTITVLALAAASSVFIALMTQFKQQSKIAEANIEGIIGLEIMRKDIANAGVGLPWDLSNVSNLAYQETSVSPDVQLNDAPSGVPVAVKSKPGVMMNQSDMLAVKSTPVGGNPQSQGWGYIYCNNTIKSGLSGYSFSNNDRMITLTSGRLNSVYHQLVVSSADATKWTTIYGGSGSKTTTDKYAPPTIGVCDQTTSDEYVFYGVDHSATGTDADLLRMPFNRADYYVKATNLPKRCAPGTGVLYKGIIQQVDGTLNELPLLDCVATMRVIFQLDPLNNNNFNYVTDISGMTADAIRSQLREVRVYILAQEGQKDPNYTYPNSTVTVGEFGLGLNFGMSAITDYQYYRWKQYNIIVQMNLQS